MNESTKLLALYNDVIHAAFNYHKHLRMAHLCIEILPEPKFSNCDECYILYKEYKTAKLIYLIEIEEFLSATTPIPPKSGDV